MKKNEENQNPDLEFVVDEEKLNAHPPTLKRLDSIEDPLKRFIRADEIAEKCWVKSDEMAKLRQDRRLPLVALYRYFGWKKSVIAAKIGAKDSRTVYSAFGVVDLRDIPDDWKVTPETPEAERLAKEEAAFKEARKLHSSYVRREAMGLTAREVRRILIYELTTGKHGPRLTNVKLAEITGRSTGLIAQNRRGSSNRAKAQKRKERREAEEAARKRAREGGNAA